MRSRKGRIKGKDRVGAKGSGIREASFDEIAAEVCREWRRLMSELVAEVAMQPKREVKALAPQGAQWQGEREGQGSKKRWGNHLAGDAQA